MRIKIRKLATIGFLKQECFNISLKTRERSDVTEVLRNSVPEIADGHKNRLTSNRNESITIVCFQSIRQIESSCSACFVVENKLDR